MKTCFFLSTVFFIVRETASEVSVPCSGSPSGGLRAFVRVLREGLCLQGGQWDGRPGETLEREEDVLKEEQAS